MLMMFFLKEQIRWRKCRHANRRMTRPCLSKDAIQSRDSFWSKSPVTFHSSHYSDYFVSMNAERRIDLQAFLIEIDSLTNVTKSFGVCGWWIESIEWRNERVVAARSPSVLWVIRDLLISSYHSCWTGRWDRGVSAGNWTSTHRRQGRHWNGYEGNLLRVRTRRDDDSTEPTLYLIVSKTSCIRYSSFVLARRSMPSLNFLLPPSAIDTNRGRWMIIMVIQC